MKLLLVVILIVFILKASNVNAYGESDSQGNPCSLERESHNLINLVRMFPVQYKSSFMNGYSGLSSVLNSYKAVTPLYIDNVLNRMSKAHSFDMANSNCFSHNDCNGTAINQRFQKWGITNTWGENIAAGNKDGITTNNQLICDSSSGNKVCSGDNSGSDGHRKNIMSSNFQFLGVGYYSTSTSTYKNYWTQDFSGSGSILPTNPIYSGYHTFYPSTTIPKFIVMFYSKTQSLSSMSIVFVGGSTFPMTLTYGNSSYAAYTYTPTSFTVSCQQYYFQGNTTNTSTFRYPDTGYLQVSKDTTCSGWSITTSVSIIANLNLGLKTNSETKIETETETETETPKSTNPPPRKWNWFWDYKLLSNNNYQEEFQQQQEQQQQQDDDQFYNSSSNLIETSFLIFFVILILKLLI
ncbi:hypothetical protein RB653_010661 [Dictyostelium firmibasis]|uniref:SCP domain-containing protein n=1 Tax=Dictyostelium firmibasis TaxID=79012 RepID=A0AAN7YN74_9MYCE